MKAKSRKESKNETLDRILLSASRLIKERGIDGVSIDDVMNSVGLTRGSFYAYFKDKSEMVVKASAYTVELSHKRVRAQLQNANATPEIALGAFLSFYLSSQHVMNVADGCPVAALSREIAKSPEALRKEFTRLLDRTIEDRRKLLTKDSHPIDRKEWVGIMSTYVGALILSRACRGENLSNEILEGARDFINRKVSI